VFNQKFEIGPKTIGTNEEAYFVADIGANHDGSFQKAIDLINLASEAGANAAKFQHFNAATIVSDKGFRELKGVITHQSSWEKSVAEVYEAASVSQEWTQGLFDECKRVGIEFFTSPYAPDLVDHIDPFVNAHKIGSGDITWLEIIKKIASKGKPVLLAAGASNSHEVHEALQSIARFNRNVCLMQCNTNYTGSLDNFRFINLNVLKTFRSMYPDIVLGLSDHTPGHSTVLGAVSLGASVIEKHFTDNRKSVGPDHHFAMEPSDWSEMVERRRELELALGSGVKKVEENESSSVIVQRRSIRSSRTIEKGEVIRETDLTVLRPCPASAVPANQISNVLGRVTSRNIPKGAEISFSDFVV